MGFSVTTASGLRFGRYQTRSPVLKRYTGALMINRLHILTTALLVTLSSVSFADDEDLFSDFSARSVFSESTDSKSASGVPDRATSGEDLRELLKAAGFEAKAAGSRVATTQKKLEPWTFPILAVLSEDESTVSIVLGLATVKDVGKELTAEKLLKMMETSQNNAPTMFVYNSSRQRVEVSKTMQNLNLTGQLLRDTINQMAILAKSNSAMWANAEQKPVATPNTKLTTTPTAPTSVSVAATTLEGKWTAARSDKEAFGIEFKSDRTFSLVYINDGQQSKSAGQFTITNDTLSLTGNDGLKLAGKISMVSATEFKFEPANMAALSFTKAK